MNLRSARDSRRAYISKLVNSSIRTVAVWASAGVLVLLPGAVAGQAGGPPAVYRPLGEPDLSGFWQHSPIQVWQALPFKAEPVQDLKGTLNQANLLTVFEGDDTAPILRAAAAAEVKRHTDAVRAGTQIPTPQEACRPSGVPNVMTLPAPVEFLQLPDRVVILYQRDHQVRHIWLTGRHSDHVTPSWYGESIGHYDGDTLVVDTIGFNAKTPVDIFGTPHTEDLHVVERIRTIDNGRQLEVVFTVDDPRMFTSEWSGRTVYNRANLPPERWEEEVCAENDRLPNGEYDIPAEPRPVF